MSTFYLFRHGATHFSKNKIPYGDFEHSAEVLPEAIPSIEKIAKYLDASGVHIAQRSEFLRCAQTAKIIEDNSEIRFTPNPLLNEFTEYDFHTFKDRMVKLSAELTHVSDRSFALCTHGAVIAALKRILLFGQQAFQVQHLVFYPKTGVILKINDGQVEEVDFNEAS